MSPRNPTVAKDRRWGRGPAPGLDQKRVNQKRVNRNRGGSADAEWTTRRAADFGRDRASGRRDNPCSVEKSGERTAYAWGGLSNFQGGPEGRLSRQVFGSGSSEAAESFQENKVLRDADSGVRTSRRSDPRRLSRPVPERVSAAKSKTSRWRETAVPDSGGSAPRSESATCFTFTICVQPGQNQSVRRPP